MDNTIIRAIDITFPSSLYVLFTISSPEQEVRVTNVNKLTAFKKESVQSFENETQVAVVRSRATIFAVHTMKLWTIQFTVNEHC